MEIAVQNRRKKKSSTEVEEFYEKVTRDYQFWDTNDNMHFGYCSKLKEAFSLSLMVKNMNHNILNHFKEIEYPTLIDIGCGTGASLQYAEQNFPNYHIYGVTLSRFQKEWGNQKLHNMQSLNKILLADYESLPIPDDTFDGAYAIESLCHSGFSQNALSEIYRTLKVGGKLVVADALIKKSNLNSAAKYLKRNMEINWYLKEIISVDELIQKFENQGFKNISIQEITWRVAPSVLHIPKTILKYYAAKIFNNEKIEEKSHQNAKASFNSLLTAFFTKSFGYFMVTAEK